MVRHEELVKRVLVCIATFQMLHNPLRANCQVCSRLLLRFRVLPSNFGIVGCSIYVAEPLFLTLLIPKFVFL